MDNTKPHLRIPKVTVQRILEQREFLTKGLEHHSVEGNKRYLSKMSLRYLEGMKDALDWVIMGHVEGSPEMAKFRLVETYTDCLPYKKEN